MFHFLIWSIYIYIYIVCLISIQFGWWENAGKGIMWYGKTGENGQMPFPEKKNLAFCPISQTN